MRTAIAALEKFEGIKRRMEIVGTRNGVTVIDDFGHNPDKIAAGLKTLKQFPDRLIVMFQPHGFGPLKLMGREIADTFKSHLDKGDLLMMPEAYYAGGTADRSVTAKHVVEWAGPQATWFEKRADILPAILSTVKSGDRVIIMGARDDTLGDFAREILGKL
jgi:UDP-N-acetylmuramate--alanine ligase